MKLIVVYPSVDKVNTIQSNCNMGVQTDHISYYKFPWRFVTCAKTAGFDPKREHVIRLSALE